MTYCGRTTSYNFPDDTKILTCRVFKRKLVVVLSSGHVIQCRGDFDHQELHCSDWNGIGKECFLISVRRTEYIDLEHVIVEFVTDSGTYSATFSEAIERDYLNDPSWHTPITTAISLSVMDIAGGDPLSFEEIQHADSELCNPLLREFHNTNKQNCI